MGSVNVLITYERNQKACEVFRKKGANAYTCDQKPCIGGHPEWHIQDNPKRTILGWVKVIHADECIYEAWDEDRECGVCPECKIEYSECLHPGPTMDIEYKEFDGVLYGKIFKWNMIIKNKQR